MSNWVHFPLDVPRPDINSDFNEKQRDELELLVAHQVSGLLRHYGEIIDQGVDNSGCPDVDEPQTFYGIEVDCFVFDDDSELLLGQFPDSPDGFVTSAGAHAVRKLDDDGSPEFCITVWDPEVDSANRVHTSTGDKVELATLNELYHVLFVIASDFAFTHDAPENNDPSEYPIPVVEPIIETMAQQFLGDE